MNENDIPPLLALVKVVKDALTFIEEICDATLPNDPKYLRVQSLRADIDSLGGALMYLHCVIANDPVTAGDHGANREPNDAATQALH